MNGKQIMIEKLGLQLYTIRQFMDTEEHVRDCFRRIKSLGYDVAQTAGCSISHADFVRIAAE